MSLNNALRYLNKNQRKELESILRQASICYESGNRSPKEFLAKEAKKYKGAMKSIIKAVINCSKAQIDEISHVMSIEQSELNNYVPRWQR